MSALSEALIVVAIFITLGSCSISDNWRTVEMAKIEAAQQVCP